MADPYAQAKVGPDRRSEPITSVETDGSTTQAEMETAVNAILEALRKAGIVKV